MDRLFLLGSIGYATASSQRLVISNPKAQALVTYVAMSPNRTARRDVLASLLWEDSDEERARANLRKTLSRLNRQVTDAGGRPLLADTSNISFSEDKLIVDALEVEASFALATPEALQTIQLLSRGDFGEGLDYIGNEFRAWLDGQRRRLNELVNDVRRRLSDHYIAIGAIDAAIEVLIQRLADDSLQEPVHRQLMELYLHQERIGSALGQYKACEQVLSAELGIEPSNETKAVLRKIRRSAPDTMSLDKPGKETDTVPERAELQDLLADARNQRRKELNGRPSVVVLSFSEREHAETTNGRAWLGTAVAEEVATALGRFAELEVVASSTAFIYQESGATPLEIAAELGVAYVCEGRVNSTPNRTSVSARLIDARTGRQLWAERYDQKTGQLLEIQDDMVVHIATALIGKIQADRLKTSQAKRPNDIRAYEFWLRGRMALRRPNKASLDEARQCFEEALQRDPNYARAYVGLAMLILGEGTCYRWKHWVFAQSEALEHARKALAADPDDTHAHCILGMTEFYCGEHESAQERLRRAVKINPNDTDVLAHAAAGFALLGKHSEAVDAGRRAIRLAPHHPEWYAAFAGIALFAAREYKEGITTMAVAPEAMCNTPAFIAASYAYMGQEERGKDYTDTVQRHHKIRTDRGDFPAEVTCMDWLLAMDPFRDPDDLEHYADGLRRSGFSTNV